MSDIFEDLFGDMGGRRSRSSNGRERGSDLRYNLEITLEDAFTGKQGDASVAAITDAVATAVIASAGAVPALAAFRARFPHPA